MDGPRRLFAVAFALLSASLVQASALPRMLLTQRLPQDLHGQVLDFTHNHGTDHRIYSNALCEKRDLYVYLPPGFCIEKQYPVLLYLHGFAQDESGFLILVKMIDKAMACGQLPPMIVAAPDGSVRGRASYFDAGSFYINSKAGKFEDYIIQDVWCFLKATFPIRPERGAHILGGSSMGGFGAFNLGIKYKAEFGQIAGIMPPLNVRYSDCHGRYLGEYHPECFGYQERVRPLMPIARFYGVLTIRERRIIDPLFGHDQNTTAAIARENPIEMLTAYDVRPGEQNWYIGYGKKDEFNLDAQCESFLDVARSRGLCATVVVLPEGHHSTKSGSQLFASFCQWTSDVIAVSSR